MPNYQVCLANIANVYLYRRQFLAAISYYQQALELARQLGDQLSIGKWLRNLGQAYAHLGNPALAQGFESEAKLVNERPVAERQRAANVSSLFKPATGPRSISGKNTFLLVLGPAKGQAQPVGG
jgi:tetratricopeptide (TPR) repeat protein